jgi:hypothetical protein
MTRDDKPGAPPAPYRPSDAVREKAQAAKAAGQRQRMEQLHGVLDEIDAEIAAGTLRSRDVTHEAIFTRAGLSRATYYRYLDKEQDLQRKAQALAGATGRNDAPQEASLHIVPAEGFAGGSGSGGDLRLQAQIAENERLKAANVNLMQQLAICKVVLGDLERDLAARTKEATSKDFQLSAERANAAKLAARLHDLSELCHRHGLAGDLGAAASPQSLPDVQPDDGKPGAKLRVLKGRDDPE